MAESKLKPIIQKFYEVKNLDPNKPLTPELRRELSEAMADKVMCIARSRRK